MPQSLSPHNSFRSACVVGLGYIGLPTAAALAVRGIQVVGVDVSQDVVDSVADGRVPFAEPDLAAAVGGAVSAGKLTASREPKSCDAYIIAVPTPFLPDRTADLSFVHAAARAVAPHLRAGQLVVLESTSPPGTTAQLASWLAEERADLKFPLGDEQSPDVNVAHCPERVLPGRIMIEIATNDRVVGGLSFSCAARARELYSTFCQGEISEASAEEAELAKLAENSYRDVNIAFANELSLICDKLDIDVWGVIRIANRHPRVNILRPGPGVGGHCIAVDPWFIVSAAPEQSRLIRTAREVNDDKPQHVVRRVLEAADAHPVIACLGLAFKADVEDLRESPSVQIVHKLSEQLPHHRLLVVEPHVDRLPTELADRPNIELVDFSSAVLEASLLVLLVDHTAFRDLSEGELRHKHLIDTRGFLGKHC